MINIAICDDEDIIINQIENKIINVCEKEHILVGVDVFYGGVELEKAYTNGYRYDLIFLSIQMDNGNGIDAARKIRALDENVILVFVSCYDKYMIELFELDVMSYIKKPIDEEKLKEVLLSAFKRISNKNFYFSFKYQNMVYKIACKDIVYFESVARKIHIYLKDGRVEVFYGKLTEVEEKLAEGKVPFLRIHQSYLVNYHMVKARTKSSVILVTGQRLSVSEERQKSFLQSYEKLLSC